MYRGLVCMHTIIHGSSIIPLLLKVQHRTSSHLTIPQHTTPNHTTPQNKYISFQTLHTPSCANQYAYSLLNWLLYNRAYRFKVDQ